MAGHRIHTASKHGKGTDPRFAYSNAATTAPIVPLLPPGDGGGGGGAAWCVRSERRHRQSGTNPSLATTRPAHDRSKRVRSLDKRTRSQTPPKEKGKTRQKKGGGNTPKERGQTRQKHRCQKNDTAEFCADLDMHSSISGTTLDRHGWYFTSRKWMME
jgi:hypothetical protein